ncbi:MAG: hypothetical protein R3E86_19865 [Pseudomonadales bacterium]
MTTVLELNDAALTLHRNADVVYRAPALAVLLEPDLVFGERARHLSRTHPRQTNQQYLSRLNADPLPFTVAQAHNHADLVYLHLRELTPLIDEPVLIAVPGVVSPEQLGVLLGILEELGVEVCGFVDTAAAAVSAVVGSATERAGAAADACFLDVLLQRAVVTRLNLSEEIARASSQEIADCGLAKLLDAWINVIADRFISETRFDPLHAAATEQQLYDQVYDWIDDPDGGAAGLPSELSIEIVQGEQARRVEFGRTLLEDKGAQRFHALHDLIAPGSRVFVPARCARLPGLRTFLSAQRCEVTVLPQGSLYRGCTAAFERITAGTELRLVTRLPAAGGSGTPSPQVPPGASPSQGNGAPAGAGSAGTVESPPAGDAGAVPTHALLGTRAWPLGARSLPLPVRLEGRTALLTADDGLTLNGKTLDRDVVLCTGDRIGRGQEEYLIIHVTP